MPYGTRNVPDDTGGVAGGPPALIGRDGGDPAGQGIVEQLGAGASDMWKHYRIDPARLAGGAVVAITFPHPATKLRVIDRDGAVIRVGLDKTPTAVDYDLIVPVAGDQAEVIIATRRIELYAETNPTNAVEVYAYAGTFAAREV